MSSFFDSHESWGKIASLSATFLKMALVRGFIKDDIVIGENATLGETYTADFRDHRNLMFFDRHYMPLYQEFMIKSMEEGRGTALQQLYTPQGVYAVETGSVATFDFKEISELLYPDPKAVSNRPPLHEGSGATVLSLDVYRRRLG